MTTALAGLLVIGSWVLLRKLGPGPAGTLCLWPAVGLLAVQRQYAFPWLETGLGSLGALWLAAAYVWVPSKRPWLRWLVFLAISCPSYALLAGAYLVLARMALSLGTGFSGVAFPVTITVTDFPELVARSIEQGKGFRSAFDGAGFPTIETLGHLVARDDL